MDRNSTIGLLLITGLLFVYFQFMAPSPETLKTPEKPKTSTSAPAAAKIENAKAVTAIDSAQKELLVKRFGKFASAIGNSNQVVSLENEVVKVDFNTQGAKLKLVTLKNFKTYDGKALILADSINSKLELSIPTPTGLFNLSQLTYTPTLTATSLSLRANISANEYVEHVFSFKDKSSYEVNYTFNSSLAAGSLTNEAAVLSLSTKVSRTELDVAQQKITSTINYLADEEFDKLSESSFDEEKAELEKVKWVSFKSKFFVLGVINEGLFTKASIKQKADEKDSVVIKNFDAQLQIPSNQLAKTSLKLYFGPNDIKKLDGVSESFGENVYLGWPVIKHINRYFVYPVFELVKGIGNYGLVIILLVLVLKLVLLPLSYKSYLSMAKMRVMKPETDALKEKYGDDMTKIQQESMKLYQEVGVNPLSGCVPMLLSAPFLIAMFSFFPNLIDLRQQSFLWAHDLSSFDSVYTLPFKIPGYGQHVSLFTILMTLSTLAYTWMNNQVSTVQGPMKTMSYLMPIMFTFVLNSYAAGLTFYYFVSNIVTMAQQYIIKYFVDEDKIKAKMEENRKKFAAGGGTAKKGGFMKRMEEAMKAQEELKKQQKGGK